MRRSLALGLTVYIVFGASSAGAGEAGRHCSVLGQMSLATWLDLMGALSGPDRDAVDAPLDRLASLTGTYASVGCDTVRLGSAMDCVLDRSGSAAPRELARQCLQENGLAAAQ